MLKNKHQTINNRKLYPVNDDAPFVTESQPPAPPPPPPHLVTMDSSMVLVILVLSTALVSVIFFCFYLCRPNPVPSSSTDTTNVSSRKGVDPAAVPVSSYGGVAKENNRNVECAICLGEFGENDDVKVMPFCRHVFHPCCIDTWLASHVTCPVCRSTRVLDEVGGGEEWR
ncbi:RING-H2 finger protein ATL57 [Cannabis sativa]|uniref:RING-type E3 ubiquitin transferase n=2 Tax=Cannabis sativa TaxID=3483 RepID=A0A7J6E5V4_CANSA|nr:RING-H2 finger protein ATL57 [Cannabis sativa]KAF4353029.1 hypothetical protein G4B88_010018 [Cannabis sativa]KAF4390819.1 hypothetical protein G4B88_015709 [Cannabis sativa]